MVKKKKSHKLWLATDRIPRWTYTAFANYTFVVAINTQTKINFKRKQLKGEFISVNILKLKYMQIENRGVKHSLFLDKVNC